MLNFQDPLPDESEAAASTSYCNLKWDEARRRCRNNLRDHERDHMETIRTCDDFKQSIHDLEFNLAQRTNQPAREPILPLLDKWIDSLVSFVALLAGYVKGSAIEIAVIWGLTGLLLRSASETDSLLPKTIEMLQDLEHDLEIIQIHDDTLRDNPPIGDELVEVFVKIIILWTEMVQFLNRNTNSLVADRTWPRFHEEKIASTFKEIKQSAARIKEKSNTMAQKSQADLLKEYIKQSSSSSFTEVGIFPYSNIPHGQNPRFFGRENELNEVRQHLGDSEDGDTGFRSFALYGAGGIGKTQTAIAYAYEQKKEGVEAVLWFDCETGLSLQRSFANVAKGLRLEGASEDEASDQNRLLLLRWLRDTSRTWLCVFDNVEDLDMFQRAWPVADSGKVLVTSRNHIVSIDPAAGGIEIEVFNDDVGCQMILDIVGRPKYTEMERAAARQLTNRLDGLPLALVVMASHIKLWKKSISSFVKTYERNSERLKRQQHGTQSLYPYSLATCWQTAFQDLSPLASSILGVIAHLGPDALPEDLFRPENPSDLPPGLENCEDEYEFDEALMELMSTSLVRKLPEKNVLFVHRLIQEAFREYIGPDKRHDAFVSASKLLYCAFPKLILGQSMRPFWPGCKSYVQHVLILCARWQEFKFQAKIADEFKPFLLLSTSCGWYLMESGAWSEEIELMEAAMTICQDHSSVIYAILANSRGEMECERGHCEEAYKYMKPSLDIMRKRFGDDHTEVGNGYNNYANIILQELREGACETAIVYYNKALEIFEAGGPEIYTKIFHIPHTNMARAYMVLENYEKAIEHAEESRKWAVAFLGEGCHFDGLADYHVGNALFAMAKVDEAEKHWLRALDLFSRENHTHPTTNAAKIKLSIVKMSRGQYDEAITMLRNVLLIARLNKPSKGDLGEVARIQRQLSKAYELKGDVEEARRLRTEAETMRREIQGPRFKELPDCDLSYAMMNFHAFW